MADKKKKKKRAWFKKATRIVGMDPKTFKEAWEFKINRIQAISVGILAFIVFLVISYVLFFYTPIGNLFPDSVSHNDRKKIEAAKLWADKLNKQAALQLQFTKNYQQALLGKLSADSIYAIDSTAIEDLSFNQKIDTSTTPGEQELGHDIKKRKEVRMDYQKQLLSHLFLFDPVEGKISQRFDETNHPGVDLITAEDAQIKACLAGIVLNTSLDVKDGYTIIIVHKNGFTSVYKHAKSVAVKPGEHVDVGEVIGVVGNTGTRSTGPHLHFEFWSDRGPLDPMNYFSFGS